MEKPLFPSEYMRITQGYNEGTHRDSYAIDNAGKDTGISDVYAPFTGTIKKIYATDANEVWLESVDKVEYADGTIDFLTVLFAHANDVSNLFVGKIIKQGENFYQEGTKGNAKGNHCHIECGRGKFSNNGWHKNNAGYWSIDNGIPPESCLWINDKIKVLNNYSYNFKKIPQLVVEKEDNSLKQESPAVEEKETKPTNTENENQTEQTTPPKENTTKKKFTFIAPKTDLYGIYLKENDELIINPSS